MGAEKERQIQNEDRRRERLHEEARERDAICPKCGRPIVADNIEHYKQTGQCKPGCDAD